jgi:hypothetical protein
MINQSSNPKPLYHRRCKRYVLRTETKGTISKVLRGVRLGIAADAVARLNGNEK